MLGLMEKPLVRLPVYAAVALVAFAVSMAFTFPDDQIKDIVVVQMEKQLGPKYKVSIGDLDLWWITGVELSDVTIAERTSPQEEAKKSKEKEAEKAEGLPPDLPMKVTIPSVSGRLSLIRSLFSGPTVEFRADVGGGEISGYFQQASDGRTLDIDFDEIDLRRTTALTSFFGVPFFGVLDGDVHFVLNPKRPQIIDGHVDLEGSKLTVGPATVKTDKFPPITYLEIPQSNFGTLTIKMKVTHDEGKAPPRLEFQTVKWSGRDLLGEAWGYLTLTNNIRTTRSKVKMRMQLDEKFVRKNDLGPLLNVAEVRRGKNKNWFGFEIYGRLSNLQFKGSPAVAGGKGHAGGKRPGPGAKAHRPSKKK